MDITKVTRRQALVVAATPFLAPYLLGKASASSKLPDIDLHGLTSGGYQKMCRKYYEVDNRFYFHRLGVTADKPTDKCLVATHAWHHQPEQVMVPFQFIHNHHKYISDYCKHEAVGGAEYRRVDIYKIFHERFTGNDCPRYTPIGLLSMSSITTKPTFWQVKILAKE